MTSTCLNIPQFIQSLNIREGDIVVDLGCGMNGHVTFPVAHVVGESGKVYAVDILPDAVQAVKNKAPHHGVCNVHGLWGDVERDQGIALSDSSVDHIFCVNSLWHVQNPDAMVTEIKRLLRPGGSVYIVDWKRESRHPIAPKREDRPDPMNVHRLFAEHQAQVRHFPVGDHHWGIHLIFPDA